MSRVAEHPLLAEAQAEHDWFFARDRAREPGRRFANATAMATAWRHAVEGAGTPDVKVLRGASGDSEEGGGTMPEGPGSTR